LNNKIYKRINKEVDYVLNNNLTIRQIAKKLKISKSTVHKDLHERLLLVNRSYYKKVDEVFQLHLKNRHINGGNATKDKYKKLRKG